MFNASKLPVLKVRGFREGQFLAYLALHHINGLKDYKNKNIIAAAGLY